jgi:hypothetical protein
MGMTVKELQKWLNAHGASTKLKEDGIGGTLTKSAFIQVFVNKDAKAITKDQLLEIAKSLGDDSIKRIEAVGKVESNGSGWFDSGLPKILWERHYFYRLTRQIINTATFGLISSPKSGGYTTDVNKNGVNDSWEKLAEAACVNPDKAIMSVSIGKFQVMGSYYSELGYNQPIDMLWAARNSEYDHYKMLAGYIKMAKLIPAFLSISTIAHTNIPFVKGYNGPAWEKNDYASKLAIAMR